MCHPVIRGGPEEIDEWPPDWVGYVITLSTSGEEVFHIPTDETIYTTRMIDMLPPWGRGGQNKALGGECPWMIPSRNLRIP